MSSFIDISLRDLIPLPIQRKIGIENIRGDTLSRIIKKAFDHSVVERPIDCHSYKNNQGEYYIYKLGRIIDVISKPQIEGLTYIFRNDGFIKFNKPIPPNTEVIVKFSKKFEDPSDSFRYYARQYFEKPIINYLVTFFSDYLNDTPQDKITEATLITYINNYKKE